MSAYAKHMAKATGKPYSVPPVAAHIHHVHLVVQLMERGELTQENIKEVMRRCDELEKSIATSLDDESD